MPPPRSTALPAMLWGSPWSGTSSVATGGRSSPSEHRGGAGGTPISLRPLGVELSLLLSPPLWLCGTPGSAQFCSPRYGGGSFSFSRLISSVTQRFSSEFELQQVRLDPGSGQGTRDPNLGRAALCQQPLRGGFLPLVCPGVTGYWDGGRDSQGLSECSQGLLGCCMGCWRLLGCCWRLLRGCWGPSKGCQGATGAVRMMLGGVGGCWSGAAHRGYWGAPGGCWGSAREQLRAAGVVLECSQGLSGAIGAFLGGVEWCWELLRSARGCRAHPLPAPAPSLPGSWSSLRKTTRTSGLGRGRGRWSRRWSGHALTSTG